MDKEDNLITLLSKLALLNILFIISILTYTSLPITDYF